MKIILETYRHYNFAILLQVTKPQRDRVLIMAVLGRDVECVLENVVHITLLKYTSNIMINSVKEVVVVGPMQGKIFKPYYWLYI